MEAVYEERKQELLQECEGTNSIFDHVSPRFNRFMMLFADRFGRREQAEHANTMILGLLWNLQRKNTESIAYRFGQPRMPLQWFVGGSHWDDRPLRDELVRQVAEELGEDDAVIVFDPSAFPKKGRMSAGVERQWCGRNGKVDNCQVGVFMGYVSGKEHATVDTRLYLPKSWTQDKKRCEQAGVPKEHRRHRTRHQLCLEMLAQHGDQLPHGWIAGDDEMGRPYTFRRRLDRFGERDMLAVPSNTLIRDLDTPLPEYSGRGRPPRRPWTRVDRWAASLDADAWETLDVRDGAKGPLIVESVKRRVKGRNHRRQEGHEEILVVIRYRDRDNAKLVKTDSYMSNASAETPLVQFARVAKAEHRIEECLQRSKSETGLGDYEARNWKGWHHHQTLSLIATWFLVKETRRGKKIHSRNHASTDSSRHIPEPPTEAPMRHTRANRPRA